MENVKGILSARLSGANDEDHGRVFERIRADLSDPSTALTGDADTDRLTATRTEPSHRYRLYSLVLDGNGSEIKDAEFLIRSELHGVPQKRHRVILLGVRDDVTAAPKGLKQSDAVTVREVISDLPKVRSGRSKNDGDWTDWVLAIREAFKGYDGPLPGPEPVQDIICDFLYNADEELGRGAAFIPHELPHHNAELARWYHDPRLGGVIQHEARSHMTTDLTRYLYAAAVAQISGQSPSWRTGRFSRCRSIAMSGTTRLAGSQQRVSATGSRCKFGMSPLRL